jgi:hypothetical protein
MASDNTVPIGSTSYRQAFDRIRAEYQEMPGMRLNLQQVGRLSGVDASICKLVLDDLVRAKFLRIDSDGTYLRVTGDGVSRRRATETQAAALSRPTRRAS